MIGPPRYVHVNPSANPMPVIMQFLRAGTA
jgi:hypothetical protein